MTSTSADGFGSLFQGVSKGSNGAQTSWAINPLLGSDSNVGTPAAPLATMAEFSARLNNALVSVASTLQLVGDVIDSPLWLNGTRFGFSASLTVSGTRTDLGTATVTVVTGLGPTTAVFPWQVTTTGIDWTTVALGSQLRFSTGQTGWIVEVVNATNVIIGAIAAPGFGSSSAAPTVSSTITIASLSRCLPPILLASAAATPFASTLTLQDLSIDSPGNFATPSPNQYGMQGNLPVTIFGCEMKFSGTAMDLAMTLPLTGRCCRWTYASGQINLRTGANAPDFTALTVVGTGALFLVLQTGRCSLANCTISGTRLIVNQGTLSVTTTHIRRTAGPVLVNDSGRILAAGIVNGATGNTGIGIDVPLGQFAYTGGGNKPTVTGASDTRVGGTAKTYAQIPFTAYDATAPTNLVGNGSSIVQQ